MYMAQADTQFKPGQSGNPKGRPKGAFSLKSRVVNYLEDNPKDMEAVVESLAKDPKYRSLLFTMVDGRPSQQVEIGHRELPIPILGKLTKVEGDKDT